MLTLFSLLFTFFAFVSHNIIPLQGMTDIPFYTKVACTITKMLMHHQLLESFHLVDTGKVYNEKTCNVTLQLDTVHAFTDSTDLQDFQSAIWVKSIVPSFM